MYSYIINELGEEREFYFNAIAPPIIQTSNFVFNSVAEMGEAIQQHYHHNLYTRGNNPTASILAAKLAALDGAEAALVVNSGCSAITAAVVSNVSAGDHIISVNKPYTWAQQLFDDFLLRMGVHTTYVNGTDTSQFVKAIQPNTKLIYLESPNSWTYDLQDLPAIAQLAHQHNILTVIDNTYCTPFYQQPISMGIDITVQSASKYIGGHSDVVAGVLCGKTTMVEKIFHTVYQNFGLQTSPMNAWLLLRGLRTLPMRLERISDSTKKVVAFLKQHPAIESVLFPFDESFPQYQLAKKQMKDAFGLITVTLKDSSHNAIIRFCEGLQRFLLACSWGGHESLVFPKCAGLPVDEYDPSNRDHRMIRLYVGLDEAEVLIEDLMSELG
jgi:cystathionine beta-lyase/cystathionine gamma-synthase